MSAEKVRTSFSSPSMKSNSQIMRKKARNQRLDPELMNKTIRRVLAPYINKEKQRQSLGTLLEKTGKEPIFYYQRKHNTLLKNIASYVSGSLPLTALLQETAEVLHTAVKSDDITLYLVNEEAQEIYSLPKKYPTAVPSVSWHICENSTVAAYVAFQKEYVMVSDLDTDPRFPSSLCRFDDNTKAVLCVPVVTPDGDLIAVMEFVRNDIENFTPFTMVDLQIIVTATGWLGAAYHQNQQRLVLQVQHDQNSALLELTRSYFSNAITFQTMVDKIIQKAKKLVGAKRASLFVVRYGQNTGELIGDLYEEGIDGEAESSMYKKIVPIRFNSYKGIAAEVALSGIPAFINDASTNPRYDNEMDLLTGIVTKSIFCMPVMARDGVIGVIQLVNKGANGNFNRNDEKNLQPLAHYLSLSLHYAQVQNEGKKSRLKNFVTSDLLAYHYKPCIHDRNRMFATPVIQELPPGFNKFGWYLTPYEEDTVQLLYFMITDLAENCFDEKTLCMFILTVKKCYRPNPYHNFDHAVTFTHCMYNIIKRNTEMFKSAEKKSLLIASYCHDIDHRGFTNNFMQLSNSDLIQLYPESCMENHHFQTTMHIIQATNVYSGVSAAEYRDIVDDIHDAIISTDLALYFRCRPRLSSLIVNNEFDWNITNHRVLIKSMMMTACDLSGQCKPFHVARKITESLYREFYHQGDLEKAMGLTPLSMMDREKQQTIPIDQMRFIDIVVLPCVDLLVQVLPNTFELFTLARDLRNQWEDIIELKAKARQKIESTKQD